MFTRLFSRKPAPREADPRIVEKADRLLNLVEEYDYSPWGEWPAVPNKYGRGPDLSTFAAGKMLGHHQRDVTDV